jgi:curved DNA-binding protein CbpA
MNQLAQQIAVLDEDYNVARLDLARVDEKLAEVRRADYFAILGLARGATPDAARHAADRLLALLSAEALGDPPPDEVTAKLAEIREVIGEARAVLTDEVLRTAYLAGLDT